jgi:hypothetical protein
MLSTGQINIPALGLTSAASYADGADHLIEMMYSGGLWVTLIDGAGGIPDTAGALVPDNTTFTVGGGGGYATFNGTLSMAVFYSASFSVVRSAAHVSALSGFPGESGTTRITRLAGYANLPVGTLDASLTNVAGVDTTGVFAWAALQQVADAEMGLDFFDGSGNLTFHNRNRVPAKATPDLTLDKQYLLPGVQPVIDDQQLINYLQGTSTATGAPQIARSVTSEVTNNHGRYDPGGVEYLVLTDQEVLDRINWIVGLFAEPTTRYGTLTINLYKMTPALAQSVLSAIELNCWLRVTSMPTQNTDGSTTDVIVEGFTERQDGDTWTLECNVVSRALFSAWILGDSTYSVLGSTTRLYV